MIGIGRECENQIAPPELVVVLVYSDNYQMIKPKKYLSDLE